MTRKDYVLIAKALREAMPFEEDEMSARHDAWLQCVSRMANNLVNTNSNFDRSRFIIACCARD